MPEKGPSGADTVVLSNRGPLSFHRDSSGTLAVKRAAGGLVVAVGPGVQHAGALWVGSAISGEAGASAAIDSADREPNASGVVDAEGFRFRSLEIESDTYRAYYDVIANGTLWFCLHGLWDLPRRPRFDRHWYSAWESYREVNRRFASVAAEVAAPGSTVLVQDYQLALVGGILAGLRPDLRIAAFLHTPWCDPAELEVLPDSVAAELVEGLAGAGAVGFHARRWADAFARCCAGLNVKAPAVFVSPATTDLEDLRHTASSPACQAELTALCDRVGDRQLIVRVERIELSKNVLRGFWAYDHLLEERPDLRGRIVFGAYVYPSRQGLAEYLSYAQEVETLATVLNDKWATPSWTPILLDDDDDYPRSVAALRRADVIFVNPVRDGLNLVAKEGPLVNERDATLVLSRRAGCWEELGAHSITINPFDVRATAEALGAALDLDRTQRRSRAAGLRQAIEARTPLDWWRDVTSAARPPRP
jgi:trehalose 6-phosphate synthase